ncbi:MAG: hypothetical protein ACM3KF_02200 [Acidobacteriota bacterium]
MKKFRESHPIRTADVAEENDYHKYLPQLTKDFNGRCGYTDSSHVYWGVKFQIDHFAPLKPDVKENKKQAFKDGELNYYNLVYACPQVNRAKWNDWASDSPTTPILNDKGYYDPCTEDFNDHFYRTDGGGIMPKAGDVVAEYMWSKLKLYLKRYELYWRIDILKEKQAHLSDISHKIDDDTEILRLIRDFGDEIRKYENYLDLNKNSIA